MALSFCKIEQDSGSYILYIYNGKQDTEPRMLLKPYISFQQKTDCPTTEDNNVVIQQLQHSNWF